MWASVTCSGVVDHVHVFEAHAACEQALLERLDVAAVYRDKPKREQRDQDREREDEATLARGHHGEQERDGRAADERAHLVDRDVHHGLDAALLGLGHGRIEQLVGRAEERVGE